ncbi:CrcB family protein, partial [Bacillus licheniformis]
CLLIPSVAGAPAAIPVVNVVGALLLGYLTASLARAGTPPPPMATRLKLLLGTGFCGGFTTYSSLATDAAVLLDHSRVGAAAVY